MSVYQQYLAHHGILGQKWGRRQGPPYPLDAADHSAAEKKEGYKKSLGGGRNESMYDRHDESKKHHFSAKAAGSRALAKVFDTNEKFYEKHGNKQMSTMNRHAKEARLRLANEAQEAADKKYADKERAKIDSKKADIEKSIGKSKENYAKYSNKLLDTRAKNREKIESKYDKKINKEQADIDSFEPIKEGLKDKKGRDILTKQDVADITDALNKKTEKLKSKKAAKIEDFDEGTRIIKQGMNKYNQVLDNYKNAKISALEDKAFMKSLEYKKAVAEYTNQVGMNSLYGLPYTTLAYATDTSTGKHRYTVDTQKMTDKYNNKERKRLAKDASKQAKINYKVRTRGRKAYTKNNR